MCYLIGCNICLIKVFPINQPVIDGCQLVALGYRSIAFVCEHEPKQGAGIIAVSKKATEHAVCKMYRLHTIGIGAEADIFLLNVFSFLCDVKRHYCPPLMAM